MNEKASSENVAGFAGMDELIKWARGYKTTDNEQVCFVLNALCDEILELRKLNELRAARIRQLMATIEDYQDVIIENGLN